MSQSPSPTKEAQQLPVRIRKASEADVNFIFSSWLKSYRQSQACRNVANTVYYTEHHKVIERLLQSCDVYVACSDTDVADIYGFSCGEVVGGIFVLHYIYVKHAFRQMGLGTQLLQVFQHNADSAAMYTHHTRPADDLAPRYRFVYNPYIALTPDYRQTLAAQESEPTNE